MSSPRILAMLVATTAAQFLVARISPELASVLDLWMILIAGVARRGTPTQAVVTGAACGGIEDLLTSDLVGWNGFAKTLIAYLMSTVSGRVLVEHPGAITISLAAGVLANALVVGALRMLLSQTSHGLPPGIVATRVLVTAAAGLGLALLSRYRFRERWREARLRRLRA